MSRDTTQKGAGHTDLRTFDASSDRSAQRDNITTVTSTSPEHVRIQNVRTPSETEPHLERNIAGSEELELHEPTKSRKHETTQGIMPQEVGSNVDDIKESDGYHPIILDVSRRKVRKLTSFSNDYNRSTLTRKMLAGQSAARFGTFQSSLSRLYDSHWL